MTTLLRTLVRLGFRLHVENADAIPSRGAFVVIANHTSHLDAPALLTALPADRAERTHPVAARDYFFARAWHGALVSWFANVVGVERAHGVRALAPVRTLLDRGDGVILFPEGTRSVTGEVQPFRRGVGFLLAGTEYTAVPAWVEGAYRLWPKGGRWPRPGRLVVRFGEPVRYRDEPQAEASWTRVAADLERRVRALGVAA